MLLDDGRAPEFVGEGSRDLRTNVLAQLNSDRMKTRNAKEAALSEVSSYYIYVSSYYICVLLLYMCPLTICVLLLYMCPLTT